MDESRKPRIGPNGPSPLERLRQLVRDNPEEGEFLRSQKEQLTGVQIIAQIEARHGIHGLNEQRLSDFWRWLGRRKAMEIADQAVTDAREMFGTKAATLRDLHRWLVDLITATGLEVGNLSILAAMTSEIRQIMQLDHSVEKLSEAQKKKVDAGLDAIFEECKTDPKAVELYTKFRDYVREAMAQ